MHPEIAVTDWVARYPGVEEAAKALGVDRVTLWRWARTDYGLLPDPWGYKAAALMRRKPRQTAPNRSGGNKP
jgi:hypothetical protein